MIDYRDCGAEIKSPCICLFVCFTSKIRSPLIILSFKYRSYRVFLRFCSFHTNQFVPLNDRSTGHSLEALSRKSVWVCSKNMRWKLEYVKTTTEKTWMCWEPVHERTHLSGLWRFPRALVLTEDFYGMAVAGELAWYPVLYRMLGSGVAGRLSRFRVGLPSLRKQKQARSSRPAAAAGGRAEKGGSVQTHLHPAGKCRQLQFNGELSREAAFRSSWGCSFRRDRPWRRLVSEKPSQGPPAGPFRVILHCFAYFTCYDMCRCLACDRGSPRRRGCLAF